MKQSGRPALNSRSIDAATALLLFATTCCHAQAAAPTTRLITARVHIMEALGALADSASHEYGRCLVGARFPRPDSIMYVLDGIMEPVFERPIGKTNTYFVCPLFSTLAVWHNHLASEWKSLPPGPWTWPEAPTPAAEACQLSQTDLETARLQPAPIFVISVDMHTFRWWFADELLLRFPSDSALPIAVRPDTARLRFDWAPTP